MKNSQSSEELIRLMFSIALILKEEVKANQRTYKLSSAHIDLLKYIHENNAPTMKDIAEHLFVSAPSATSFTDTLIKAGYLRRVLDEEDRRIIRVTLTSKGQGELRSLILTVKKRVTEVLDELDEEERQCLKEALELLSKRFNSK
jgi:DNA-binding MarR family transcriptional regulator